MSAYSGSFITTSLSSDVLCKKHLFRTLLNNLLPCHSMWITMESSSEDSSRDGDCTNPDDDSIFRPRRSTILAKMLKYNYDAAPANTTGSSQHYWIIYKDNAKATAGRKLPQSGPGKLSSWIFTQL